MRPKVLVTRELSGTALERLREVAEVEVNTEDRELDSTELAKRLRDKDGVISMLVNVVDRELLHAAPQLKVVANYAVGYNNIDIAAASERGIVVTNTPDVLTEATADMAWALLLGIARRIPEGDAFVREGQFTGWNPTLLLGGGVHGKTLGVIGMGRIGQAVASRAKGFNMPIYYYNRRRLTEEMERHLNARYMPLEHLLEQSDFVSLHAPYSKETHHLIDEAALRMMKSTAYLVNTSRGALIDEPALVRALQSGQIAGAGLDVFEREPELAEGLARLFNVVLAPHTGSATIETRNRMAELAVANVIAVLSGKPAITAVNSRMGC